MIQTYLITAALSAALAFGAGWRTNDWRHNANQKQAIEQAAQDERELHALEQKRSSNVIAAQNVARQREVALRRDADAARSELDGLRNASAEALSRARGSHDACTVTAAAQTVVLTQCAAEYQALAADADRHASDVETLTNAWPK